MENIWKVPFNMFITSFASQEKKALREKAIIREL